MGKRKRRSKAVTSKRAGMPVVGSSTTVEDLAPEVSKYYNKT